MEVVKPNQKSDENKKKQVQEMFDNIAPSYDFLNRFLSARNDVIWRKKLVNSLQDLKPKNLLDVATGTGDVAFVASKLLQPIAVTGLDLSEKMLAVAKSKNQSGSLAKYPVQFIQGDSEALPFPDQHFEAITVSFGVRNFEDLERGLQEMYRVLKPGGRVAILEFTMPRRFPIKQLYHIYFSTVLPLIGRIRSGDPQAYTYLFNSVQAFPEYEQFTKIMESLGYKNLRFRPLTFGICTIYLGEKSD